MGEKEKRGHWLRALELPWSKTFLKKKIFNLPCVEYTPPEAPQEAPIASPRHQAPQPPGKDKEEEKEKPLVTPRTMLDLERLELLNFVQSRYIL